jgi:UDP-N-acetylmuramoylalanine--D-glutamate ligase
VENIGGIRFVNDSKATNVFSVICALDSFSEPVILIMGGRDKGSDFRTLTDWVRKHVKMIILIGEAALLIRTALAGAASMRDAAGMEEAVISAYREARPGDVVLLSPACASFDMFTDYAHRGDEFRKAVIGLK